LPTSDSKSDDAEKRAGDDKSGERRHNALSLAVIAPLAPMHESLRRLGITLTVLTLALWTGAAFTGQWLCKKALGPLTLMASVATTLGAEDVDVRLPTPMTGDELEKMALAFNGVLDRLHEALARQRRFTGEASHQFRTPLTGLLSHVDVALRRERPAEEYQRVLGVVRAKAVHLRQIVESLLFLARAEADAVRPDLESVDLGRWIPEHLQAWSAHARFADIKVRLCDEGPVRIQAHPLLLAQLLDNLLENACSYSQPGTAITVEVKHQAGLTAIVVEDHGLGLSKEDQSRIFEPFYRSNEARHRGISGVGLGLAVVRRIAFVFGGSVHVASEPGVGSRFTVDFPSKA
jgi:signal transduction histidine kinase